MLNSFPFPNTMERSSEPKSKNTEPEIENKSPTAVASSSATPQWIDLPGNVTTNILQRLGAVDVLESAQYVCTSWWKVCLDPSMWRVIHLRSPHFRDDRMSSICRSAVDRSHGQLIDLSIEEFADNDLLNFIVNRSSQLKRLTLKNCINISGEALVEAVKKVALLEELHLTILTDSVQAADIVNIGISCPILKSFSFNHRAVSYYTISNEYALAIAKSMPNLCLLNLTNKD